MKKEEKKPVKGINPCIESTDGELNCETIVVHGTKYSTLLTKKYAERKKWEKVNLNHEINLIPGTIRKLYVKGGEQLKKGDPILILEAMKMENTIFSPFDCSIKQVNVNIGDILPKGTIMVEYE